MRFGLFGSAAARRGSGEFDSAEGFRDFIEYNVEAEALGFHGTFVVEHHFTGFGQVSATLNLLTWLGARTRRLRLGHGGDRAALAQSRAAGRAGRDAGPAVRRTAGFRHRQGLPLQRIRRLRRADGGGRCALRGIARGAAEGVDLGGALLASRQILAVQRHRGRAAVGAKAASADLDGRGQRALDPQRRRARLQSSARAVCIAGRCGAEHRLVQVGGRGERTAL